MFAAPSVVRRPGCSGWKRAMVDPVADAAGLPLGLGRRSAQTRLLRAFQSSHLAWPFQACRGFRFATKEQSVGRGVELMLVVPSGRVEGAMPDARSLSVAGVSRRGLRVPGARRAVRRRGRTAVCPGHGRRCCRSAWAVSGQPSPIPSHFHPTPRQHPAMASDIYPNGRAAIVGPGAVRALVSPRRC